MLLMEDREQFYLDCANGDKNAASFIKALRGFFHTMDDIVDKDVELTQDMIARSIAELLTHCLGNSWARAFGYLLVPQIVNSTRCWVDADAWLASGDKAKEIASDVFKSYYHEVFYQIAYLCGGWDHMKKITEKYRHVDWDNKYMKENTL